MKRTIVTGATGFIGFHLLNELLSHNVEITALCMENDPGADKLPKGVTSLVCGMDDYDKLSGMLKNSKPSADSASQNPASPPDFLPVHDVFFHLAWEGATGPGRADAALQTKNTLRTLSALQAANDIGCGKFVAAGTVYEKFYKQMAVTSDFKNAAFYIMSKQYTHDMARQLALKLGIGFTWCTFCHPVGKYIKPEQLIAYTVKSLLDGHPPAFGPAEDYFDVIAVEDLAHGLYLAGEKVLPKTEYYIGSGGARPLKEYLLEIPKILGVDTPVLIGAKPDDGMRFEREWFKVEPFMEAAGFSPRITYNDIIQSLKPE